MTSLHTQHQCLVMIDGLYYHMDLDVFHDSRRNKPHPDHVVMKGDFEYLMTKHNLRHNCWLKFTLTEYEVTDDTMEVYRVVFDLEQIE